jgi:sulfur-carrier protein adenylyltransferase/sulfurtransferase
MFSISASELNSRQLHSSLACDQAGALVVFEGWVRDHNQGKKVISLEYEIYHELALKEGEKILQEARERFNLHTIKAVHREGHLKLGEIAIWIGATSSHRDEAFKATRYVIDEIKKRLPVWKKEHYLGEEALWVYCQHHSHHVYFKEADYYQKNLYSPLKNKSVLVVGAGGLGHSVLIGLAGAGVGKLTIVDPDEIEIHNIHRQFLFSPHLVGEKKALVAQARLRELNPYIQIEAICDFFHPQMIGHDLVIDCTDNMFSKFEIHDASLKAGVPLISAGIYRSEGTIRTLIPGRGCWRCMGAQTPDDSLLGNCSELGVLGAQLNALGSMQASEAIELLVRGENSSSSDTIFFDFQSLNQMRIKNAKDVDCAYCSGDFEESPGIYSTEGLLVDIRDGVDLEELKKMKGNIILACDRGVVSRKLAESLRAKGHTHFYALRGGL